MSQIKNFVSKRIRSDNAHSATPATPALAMLVLANLPVLACIAGAVYLAGGNHEGWGWPLFVAVLIAQ
ncbi:hypothetical protein [Paraburkholderia fungorum]|uniref:hypothetical protein n=1 Tax=Paraburkholderia fungorum TaxID=134537 RepID=UPI000FDA3CF0|nr:hypothetical protein [Paraburkholderia fungorum]